MIAILVCALPVVDEETERINKLRTAACENPYYGYKFALEVDKGVHPETLESAMKEPYYALLYAREVIPLGDISLR